MKKGRISAVKLCKSHIEAQDIINGYSEFYKKYYYIDKSITYSNTPI